MKGDFYFTSESVTEGHPDKVADWISDSVLDAAINGDPNSHVACETMVTTGMVMVAGEITTKTVLDVPSIVREAVKEIGYNDPETGFAADTCAVVTSLDKQSPDIAMGVNRNSPETQGAGDQGMMFGFATDETEQFMPMPIVLAHKLTQRLSEVRRQNILDFLRPDGKSQVTIQYKDNRPARVEAVVVSSMHKDLPIEQIREGIFEHVIKPVVPQDLVDKDTKIHINPTGKFVVGGPVADTGLTGRKIIVDTYGGWGRHGGGAFSGKDPSKVDRSAAYFARYVAKNIVAAGLASRCEVQLAYAIGVPEPTGVLVDTQGTGKIPDEKLHDIVMKVFDFRPGMLIRELDLLRPIYHKTAAFGHFGRDLPEFTWEHTDKVEELKALAGV